MRLRMTLAAVAAALLLLMGEVTARGLLLEIGARAAAADQAESTLVAGIPDEQILGGVPYRSIGPAVMSGRIAAIAVAMDPPPHPDRNDTVIYIGSAAGGVWKSTDSGRSFTSIFDDPSWANSIGAVAVAPSDPNIVWVGTGEGNNSRSQSWGNGVYKSTDAGETFQNMGLRYSQHTGRIVIHPTNPDIVWVAACGPLWGPGGERGIFKTTDGGQNWRNVKYISENTGFIDLQIHPTNPDILYGAAMQRERRPWSFIAGGPESGVYKSTDGGETWVELRDGLPQGDKGRIGLAISRSNPDIVYVWVGGQARGQSANQGVFRSEDGGQTFEQQSSVNSLPWYCGEIRVHPENPDRVYYLGVPLNFSEDGGRTWNRLPARMHVDHHAMWINPEHPNHMIFGNDGGAYISTNGGQSVRHIPNLPVSTFYAIGLDLREPFYRVYGGMQDNGSGGHYIGTRRGGVGNGDWISVGGGDGFYCAVPADNQDLVYNESQNGGLRVRDLSTGQSRSIRPRGQGLRWNWNSPLRISPHDPRTIYFGSNFLHKSVDRGDNWETVSPDLTRALDRNAQPIMGFTGPGGFDRHSGTAPYGNLATIDESPLRQGLLYTGSDDGLVQVSEDGGASWRQIDTFPGVPAQTYVSRVIASRHHEGTLYVTLDNHWNNDFRPYVVKSTDYGRTFTSISGNLPLEGAVRVIREHHTNPDLLFVGTEFGVFFTLDGGGSWTRMLHVEMNHGAASSVFPPVAVHDMQIHRRENDLVLGTHGRGIYVLDDITWLAQLNEAARAPEGAFFFAPRRAFILERQPRTQRDAQFFAPNPPDGVLLTHFVGTNLPAGSQLSFAVLDGNGAPVRELPAQNTPGMHRTNWDLQGPAGTVAPGEYRIQLRAGQQVLAEHRVPVLADPGD